MLPSNDSSWGDIPSFSGIYQQCMFKMLKKIWKIFIVVQIFFSEFYFVQHLWRQYKEEKSSHGWLWAHLLSAGDRILQAETKNECSPRSLLSPNNRHWEYKVTKPRENILASSRVLVTAVRSKVTTLSPSQGEMISSVQICQSDILIPQNI